MEVYVVVERIGKVFIECTKEGKKFYKELDNKLVSLNEEELKIVNELLKDNQSTTFYSKNLQKFINNNPYLSKNHDIIDDLLYTIESYIPEKYRNSFYKNVKNFKFNIKNIANEKEPNEVGSYCVIDNQLNIFLKTLNEKLDEFNDLPNPNIMKKIVYENIILHELFHMSSSKNHFDYIESGFTTLPSYEEDEKNRGLTEGMTEMLVEMNQPKFLHSITVYYPELCFTKQLTALVGKELMFDCYFNNKGVKPIIKSLKNIDNFANCDSQLSEPEKLLQIIEINFILKATNTNQSAMGYIQNTLIDYLTKKVEKDIYNNVSDEIIDDYINEFENGLIDLNILAATEERIDNFDYLCEALLSFDKFKNTYNETANAKVL